jgi:hypothetical protein
VNDPPVRDSVGADVFTGPTRQRLYHSLGSPPPAFFSVVPHHQNKQTRFNCFPSDAAGAYGHTDALVALGAPTPSYSPVI